jgi:hypothetical protein
MRCSAKRAHSWLYVLRWGARSADKFTQSALLRPGHERVAGAIVDFVLAVTSRLPAMADPPNHKGFEKHKGFVWRIKPCGKVVALRLAEPSRLPHSR